MSYNDQIREYLDDQGFSDSLIDAFMYNLDYQGIAEEWEIVDYIDDGFDLSDIVEIAFDWADTKEGSSFWYKVSIGRAKMLDSEKYDDDDVCLDFEIIIK